MKLAIMIVLLTACTAVERGTPEPQPDAGEQLGLCFEICEDRESIACNLYGCSCANNFDPSVEQPCAAGCPDIPPRPDYAFTFPSDGGGVPGPATMPREQARTLIEWITAYDDHVACKAAMP